jgi:hypothetical protein
VRNRALAHEFDLQKTDPSARIMGSKKRIQPEDDDVRAWVIIALIFCAVVLAVWIPLLVERHFLQQ